MAVNTAWKDFIEAGRCGVCGAKIMENDETRKVVFNSPQSKATSRGFYESASKNFMDSKQSEFSQVVISMES